MIACLERSICAHTNNVCVCEHGSDVYVWKSLYGCGVVVCIGVGKEWFYARFLRQLLSEASGGRLELHYDDVLTFDFEKACDKHVRRKTWEEGGLGERGGGGGREEVREGKRWVWREGVELEEGGEGRRWMGRGGGEWGGEEVDGEGWR